MADAGVGLGFHVGQRVHASSNVRRTGTVRYVGEVVGYQGEWVGVDWDDGQGKHDGSVSGVRYFTATVGEISASFVRPKALSAGINLVDALYLRYHGDSTKEEEEEMYVLSTSQKRVSVEFVGKNKIKEKLEQLQDLLIASVSYLGVSSTGPLHEVKALVPNLKELDLTGNLLSNWKEICMLCEVLSSLQVLDLTNNKLEFDKVKLPCEILSVRTLVLSNCGVLWKTVENLKSMFPVLEQLHMMANKLNMPISFVPKGNYLDGFESLRLLNLEDNHIDSWDEVLKFSYLKSLQELHLNKNSLKHIIYRSDHLRPVPHDNATSAEPFKKLQCLLLGSNEIDNMESVDSLNLFPSLTDIRLSENPIVDPSKGGVARFVLVARLPKAKVLNGSEVSPRERKDAEIRYVRLVMSKMQQNDFQGINRLHPRFFELKALHGIEDEKPTSVTLGPQKMASGLICVTLKCVGAAMGEKQQLTKKVPRTTTVGKLKILCESFFKLNDTKLRLFFEEEGSPLPQFLDDDTALLLDYGVGAEATILVDEED